MFQSSIKVAILSRCVSVWSCGGRKPSFLPVLRASPPASLILALAGAACTPLHAAQPLVTDDIYTQDTGNHQLEWNINQTQLPDAVERFIGANYTYGLSPGLDGFVGAPVRVSSSSGVADPSVGLKWRLTKSPDAGVALRTELLLPIGREERGLGNGAIGGALTLIGSMAVSSWKLHVNAAVTHYRYRLREDREANRPILWRFSTAALWLVHERLQLVIDTGLERNIEQGNSTPPAFFLVGVIYSPTPDLDLDVGIRTAPNCRDCTGQLRRQLMSGLTYRF